MYQPIPDLQNKVLKLTTQSSVVFITGTFNSGKTTLYKSLLQRLPTMVSVLETFWENEILWCRNYKNLKAPLAQRSQRVFKLLEGSFDQLPLQTLQQINKKSDSVFYGIDEIGWAEQSSPAYLEALELFLCTKRCICTLRKHQNILQKKCIFVPDHQIFDLDAGDTN